MNLLISLINYKQSSHYKVVFPYHRPSIDAIKRIPGAQWSATQQAWLVPASDQALAQLKSSFPMASFESLSHLKDNATPFPATPSSLNSAHSITSNQPTNQQQHALNNTEGVYIQVLGRRIIIKLSKNQTDIQFI